MLNLEVICNDNIYPPTRLFYSRRNQVYLKSVETNGQLLSIVVKEHLTKEEARQEVKVLNCLEEKDVKVPFCYGQFENKVFTRYIPGILLNQLVDNCLKYGYDWISALAKWYATFHRSTFNSQGQVLLKADNNLRNFLFYEGVFWGLDFESPVFGYPEQDIGEACAYILTNSPAFTEEKFLIVSNFINAYIQLDKALNFDLVRREIIKSLYKLSQFRPKQKSEIFAHLYRIEDFKLK